MIPQLEPVRSAKADAANPLIRPAGKEGNLRSRARLLQAASGTVSARGAVRVGPGGGSCLWHTAVYMQGEVFMLLFSPQSLQACTSAGL